MAIQFAPAAPRGQLIASPLQDPLFERGVTVPPANRAQAIGQMLLAGLGGFLEGREKAQNAKLIGDILKSQDGGRETPAPAVAAGSPPVASGDSAPSSDFAPMGNATPMADVPADQRSLFADATSKYGLPPGYLAGTAKIESGFNPSATNKASGAAGEFQFVPSTAKQYGLSNPYDLGAATDAAARLAADNSRVLTAALGRPPTAGELYLAHQEGAGGAVKILKDPSAPVDANAIANGAKPGMTNDQFAQMWLTKFDGSAAPPTAAPIPSATPHDATFQMADLHGANPGQFSPTPSPQALGAVLSAPNDGAAPPPSAPPAALAAALQSGGTPPTLPASPVSISPFASPQNAIQVPTGTAPPPAAPPIAGPVAPRAPQPSPQMLAQVLQSSVGGAPLSAVASAQAPQIAQAASQAPAGAPALPMAPPPPAAAPGGVASPLAQRNALMARLLTSSIDPGVKAALLNRLSPTYGFQTLPDGTIVRTDPRHGTVIPVYQAHPKPVAVGEGASLVDPSTGRVIARGGEKLTNAEQEYQYAQSQGYKGSFQDWQATSRNRGGRYYAVPTGSGTMLLDKETGMAAMIGVDAHGNPVQIGKPFRPTFDTNGNPVAAVAPPAGSVSGTMPAPAPTNAQPGVRPLMPPSIAAGPQGETARAKAQGAAEGKVQGERVINAPKAAADIKALHTQWDVVDDNIDAALKQINSFNTGMLGAPLRTLNVPVATNLARTLDAIKANLGFNRLQQMRENSPTGGALGQVSELENRLLQSTYGSLDENQSADQLRQHLLALKGYLQDFRSAQIGAFKNIYPNADPALFAVPGAGKNSTGTPGFQEGQTATNPQTGARIIYRGGQWVPLQ